MKPPIVITGASGFIGSAVCDAIRRSGERTIALSRRSIPGCERIDFTDLDSIAARFAGARAVVHSCGLAHVFGRHQEDRSAFVEANANSVEVVCRAAATAGGIHVILLSSVAVYGRQKTDEFLETTECRPVGLYAVTKLAGEERATGVAVAARMPLTILRLATVYGEGDRGNVSRLMRAIDARRFIWVGHGNNQKSLIHREDVARAITAVINAGGEGIRIFNISAPPVRMSEVVETLAAALGRTVMPCRVPTHAARMLTSAAALVGWEAPASALHKWLSDERYSAARFISTYGIPPRVSLVEGIRRQVDHYRSRPVSI